MQLRGDAVCDLRASAGEERRGCWVVKPSSERAEPWPAEERPDRGAAFRGDGSENVIMRCRSGSSPEVASRGAWLLPRQEGLDDAHAAAAAWAGMVWWFQLFGLCGGDLDGVDRDERHREQGADTRDVVGRCWAGQQAVVSDAVEALCRHMHQEAADELVGIERHQPVSLPTFEAIILPLEGHAFVVERDEAAVRDGDAMVPPTNKR
jgi:hypothetical protein